MSRRSGASSAPGNVSIRLTSNSKFAGTSSTTDCSDSGSPTIRAYERFPSTTTGFRTIIPTRAVVLAAAGSLVVFGLFHVPLGEDPVREPITSGLMGITFTAAYVLTGKLGLSIGVHFGGFFLVSTIRESFLGIELPTILVVEANAPVPYEVFVVRAILLTLLIVGWVRLTDGSVRIHRNVSRVGSFRTSDHR
ncbi:CPBP family intramembrane glutamic endopeptidase [Natrialba swarupiae]|uniref:CPBP family intramembrane metalloprotease n=1 Tax=Natrialba swarupiae TaxID=2448032 RepID=A0A5D5AIA8_9EURY|nr:CPBP family intramembrane glutamic endopeptidase [Natrialba swarupiae]TYT61588.1 CPBP family intramembrane metalloprotease [Natrialba swarupiae]